MAWNWLNCAVSDIALAISRRFYPQASADFRSPGQASMPIELEAEQRFRGRFGASG
jgi:hypothetical protein